MRALNAALPPPPPTPDTLVGAAVPGIMTLDDIANYTPIVREALSFKYGDFDLFLAPAVSASLHQLAQHSHEADFAAFILASHLFPSLCRSR